VSTRVRVIGCGTPDAGDDALGLVAVRRARSALETIPGVEVVEAGPILSVVDLLTDVRGAVVVDAVRTPGGHRAPGELVRAEAGPDGLPVEVRSSLSSHGLGLAESIGLAAAVGARPRLVFLGVEVEDVTVGHPLSPRVSVALTELVDAIVADTRSIALTVGS
jgi:hydrogenase maturation protease